MSMSGRVVVVTRDRVVYTCGSTRARSVMRVESVVNRNTCNIPIIVMQQCNI